MEIQKLKEILKHDVTDVNALETMYEILNQHEHNLQGDLVTVPFGFGKARIRVEVKYVKDFDVTFELGDEVNQVYDEVEARMRDLIRKYTDEPLHDNAIVNTHSITREEDQNEKV